MYYATYKGQNIANEAGYASHEDAVQEVLRHLKQNLSEQTEAEQIRQNQLRGEEKRNVAVGRVEEYTLRLLESMTDRSELLGFLRYYRGADPGYEVVEK